MAPNMKLDAVSAATAHHIVTGATVFPYAVDAHSAAARHPLEWSMTPWTAERADKARAARKDQHDREVAAGVKDPVDPLPDPVELAPEDQQAVDEHTQAQREAAERIARYDDYKAKEKAALDQLEADRALLAQPPPEPVKRPFGRKGEPTEKERALLAKRAADKAEADRRTQASLAVGDGPRPTGPVATASRQDADS